MLMDTIQPFPTVLGDLLSAVKELVTEVAAGGVR